MAHSPKSTKKPASKMNADPNPKQKKSKAKRQYGQGNLGDFLSDVGMKRVGSGNGFTTYYDPGDES